MGLQWAEHTVDIAATPDQVFDAITDYETFPGWQSAVLGIKVTESDRKTKLGEVVDFEVDGKIRTIYYTLRFHYDRPEKITWDFLEGRGINQMDGGWEIKPSDDGATATYQVGVSVSGVPGPILKRTQRGTVKKAAEDLKAEAERRAGAAGGGAAAEGDWEPAGARVTAAGAKQPESVTEAAMEVVGAVAKLASVAGSRALGAGRRVADGITKRLMG